MFLKQDMLAKQYAPRLATVWNRVFFLQHKLNVAVKVTSSFTLVPSYRYLRLVVLGIYVALTIFQLYRNMEAGDTQCLKS